MGVRGPELCLEGSAADDPGGAALNSSEQQDPEPKTGSIADGLRVSFLLTPRPPCVDLAARLPNMRQKYIPQIYKVRVHRTDGTRRLLLGTVR